MADEPLFICEALGCERPADWAYIGECGDMFLCEIHGGTEPDIRWVRIDHG
jgi:hypothetical protein